MSAVSISRSASGPWMRWLKAADEALLLDRRHIEEDDGAELEQHGRAAGGGGERKRIDRKRVLPLQALEIESLAKQQGPHDHALLCHLSFHSESGRQNPAD